MTSRTNNEVRVLEKCINRCGRLAAAGPRCWICQHVFRYGPLTPQQARRVRGLPSVRLEG